MGCLEFVLSECLQVQECQRGDGAVGLWSEYWSSEAGKYEVSDNHCAEMLL